MGNLQFVFNLFELVLGFGFVKRGLNMRADFGRHSDRQRASFHSLSPRSGPEA